VTNSGMKHILLLAMTGFVVVDCRRLVPLARRRKSRLELDDARTQLRSEHRVQLLPDSHRSGTSGHMTKNFSQKRSVDEDKHLLILSSPSTMRSISCRRLRDGTIKIPKEPSTTNNRHHLHFPEQEDVAVEFLRDWLTKVCGGGRHG
jgi:hypothetical protein